MHGRPAPALSLDVLPLAERAELSAHRAPGYVWLLAQLTRAVHDRADALLILRWTQAALGTLTAASLNVNSHNSTITHAGGITIDDARLTKIAGGR